MLELETGLIKVKDRLSPNVSREALAVQGGGQENIAGSPRTAI
ncbi:MAG: hypothetical protein ABI832_18650 [bacterium]